MSCTLDHLVVTAPSLEAGVAALEATLGVTLQPGGGHLRMGTHNALLRLGESLYLEVIAVDPQAPRPDRARWFDLDAPPEATRLVHWVLRSDDIRRDAALWGHPVEHLLAMNRGRYDWLITVPRDGSLPFEGVLPTLIQWQSAGHPAEALADTGCTLLRLGGEHPEAASINALLDRLEAVGRDRISIQPGARPRLWADLHTPDGTRRLGAHHD